MHNAMSTEFMSVSKAMGRRPREQKDVRLLALTKRWLSSLPYGVRPVQMPVDFTRIANELARLWETPVELDRYLAEKESDRRGHRVGFPPLVAEELNALHIYSVRRRFGRQ
jgi:hypothetical protein